MSFFTDKRELAYKQRVIDDLIIDRDRLREELLQSLRDYHQLQEERNTELEQHVASLERLAEAKTTIVFLLTGLSKLREQWIREHSDEFEDGTDIVTPFDELFYGARG